MKRLGWFALANICLLFLYRIYIWFSAFTGITVTTTEDSPEWANLLMVDYVVILLVSLFAIFGSMYCFYNTFFDKSLFRDFKHLTELKTENTSEGEPKLDTQEEASDV